jgi:hypothetical protein
MEEEGPKACCSSKLECCHIFKLQLRVYWIESLHISRLAEATFSVGHSVPMTLHDLMSFWGA